MSITNIAADGRAIIGKEHVDECKPCQDYTVVRKLPDGALIVLSDGCSQGGNTDLGARILALSMARILQSSSNFVCDESIALAMELQFGTMRQSLGISTNDFHATCLAAKITPDGGFMQIQGDGVFAWKTRDGKLIMKRYEWLDNAPFYPVYHYQDQAKSFIDLHGGVDEIRFGCESWIYDYKINELTQQANEEFSVREGMRGIRINFSAEEVDNLEYVAIFSDGVTRIDLLDWKKAVLDLIDLRSFVGPMVGRRLPYFVKDTLKLKKPSKNDSDAQKFGDGALDDLSFAVIAITHSLENEGAL